MVEIQTGRKCVSVAAALRAKDYKRKKLEPLRARVSQREPECEPQRAIERHTEGQQEP